mmetsp:Transcript_15370/g.42145  ORF Transcript_15370/g.42145 Transcript_15370/m.42145 type:complete len:356 (+) Transcript_15370:120-1187(+)
MPSCSDYASAPFSRGRAAEASSGQWGKRFPAPHRWKITFGRAQRRSASRPAVVPAEHVKRTSDGHRGATVARRRQQWGTLPNTARTRGLDKMLGQGAGSRAIVAANDVRRASDRGNCTTEALAGHARHRAPLQILGIQQLDGHLTVGSCADHAKLTAQRHGGATHGLHWHRRQPLPVANSGRETFSARAFLCTVAAADDVQQTLDNCCRAPRARCSHRRQRFPHANRRVESFDHVHNISSVVSSHDVQLAAQSRGRAAISRCRHGWQGLPLSSAGVQPLCCGQSRRRIVFPAKHVYVGRHPAGEPRERLAHNGVVRGRKLADAADRAASSGCPHSDSQFRHLQHVAKAPARAAYT